MTAKYSLIDPTPEVEEVASLLDEAANAILRGDRARAEQILRAANSPSLWAYADRALNPPRGMWVKRNLDPTLPVLAKAERAPVRMPSAAETRAVFRRDGYRCRYCGARVVLKEARSILTSHFPSAVPWPSGPQSDAGKHAAFYALNSVIDHVVPHARGGDSSPENLVTACWPCNFFKDDATLAEIGLADPRDRPPVVDEWDGLERLVSGLRRLRPSRPPEQSMKPPRSQRPKAAPRPAEDWGERLEAWADPIAARSPETARQLIRFLKSLEATEVDYSIGDFLIVNVRVNAASLAVFGIDQNGNVDVPWLIGTHKAEFRPFAAAVAEAVPRARLYETRTMWRVDGDGAAKGQISVEELVSAAEPIADALNQLIKRVAGRSE